MAWLLVVLLASFFAAPAYAGMRYQRPAARRPVAMMAAALVFATVAGWSGFATWASGTVEMRGEPE